MIPTDLGTIVPDLDGATPEDLIKADLVCPFSDSAPDETVLGRERFADTAGEFDARVGYFNRIGAGSVADDASRELSSSGGLTNWVLQRLLEKGLIDGVIHVGSTGNAGSGALFSYTVTHAPVQMVATKKSKYYATNVAEVLRSIRGDGLRYAFTGVPCFVSAARHLARNDPDYQRQIIYFVGLVCGHLKSTRFAELMAWQLGVPPDDLADVDFRRKMPGLPANRYHLAAKSRASGEWRSAVANSLYGGDWGHAFFQLKACDYCDDIFAEAADVAFGDAWLPKYAQDWLGTNIVVSRRVEIDDLIAEGARLGEIRWEPLSADELCQSQAANFRHRRDGLSLRLADAHRMGQRVPVKRVAPGSVRLPPFRQQIVRLRQQTASTSHGAFADARKAGELERFMTQMVPQTNAVKKVQEQMRSAGSRSFVGTLRRLGGTLLRKVGLR